MIECRDFFGNSHYVDASDLKNRQSVYGVYTIQGKVLLVKDPRSKRWELPGRGIEDNEDAMTALSREFVEETGLTIQGSIELIDSFIEYYYDIPSGEAWRSNRMFYSIEHVNGQILSKGNGNDTEQVSLIVLNKINGLKTAERIKTIIRLSQVSKN